MLIFHQFLARRQELYKVDVVIDVAVDAALVVNMAVVVDFAIVVSADALVAAAMVDFAVETEHSAAAVSKVVHKDAFVILVAAGSVHAANPQIAVVYAAVHAFDHPQF